MRDSLPDDTERKETLMNVSDLKMIDAVELSGESWGTWIESVLVTLPARVFWDPTP